MSILRQAQDEFSIKLDKFMVNLSNHPPYKLKQQIREI